MIDEILKVLKESNVAGTEEDCQYEYYYINRASANIFIFSKAEGRAVFFGKISDVRDFKKVYDRMKNVHSMHPQIIPEPICAFQVKKLRVLVTRAYNLELLINKNRIGKKDRGIILENAIRRIKELHLKSIETHYEFDETFVNEKVWPHVQEFCERWEEREVMRDLAQHMQNLREFYGIRLPQVPQHGDLVAYNTGLVDGKMEKVMFVDWDSYSEVKLPVLDVATFVTTFLNVFSGGVYGRSRLSEFAGEVVDWYCKCMDIDSRLISELYPVCFALYGGLRGGHGVYEGQEKALRIIREFFSRREEFFMHIR